MLLLSWYCCMAEETITETPAILLFLWWLSKTIQLPSSAFVKSTFKKSQYKIYLEKMPGLLGPFVVVYWVSMTLMFYLALVRCMYFD